ncbi:hypothetical protein GCM10007973_20430 [Polymorphobacter multimanifer]|nr:hypothetical protein GCM10007973_20430 [Polymorphobacter multimanifer]
MPRITALAEAAGVTRHMVLPTLGGLGEHGRWRRDEVTGTTAKQLFVAVLPAPRAEALLGALAPLEASHDLLIITSAATIIAQP